MVWHDRRKDDGVEMATKSFPILTKNLLLIYAGVS